jgi:hypothetical protein
METINTELILADMQTLEKAVPRLEKEVKGKKADPAVLDAAKEALAILETGKTLFQAGFDTTPIKELGLLTAKPTLFVFNVDEGVLTDEARMNELRELVAPAKAVFLDAKVESELVGMDRDEALELLQALGPRPARSRGLRDPRPADLPDGRPEGGARLDDPQGCDGPAGSRCDPHRLRARIHQGRDRLVLRPRRARFDGRRQGRGPRAHGGQGLRDGRRRRG